MDAAMIDLSASLSARVQQALQRSCSKASVDAALRALPVHERQAILVDLLASYESEVVQGSSVSAPSVATARGNGGAAKAAAPPKAATAPASAAPDNFDAGDASSLSERLLAILREKPGISIEQLSDALYGRSDNPSRNRVSTTLTHLKRRGKVELVRRGKWRAVEPKHTSRRPGRAAVPRGLESRPEKAERAAKRPSAADRVRGLLREHPEGLTTGQIRELLGPLQPRDKISTIVAKMSGRGLLVASGKKGSSIYKLTETSGGAAAGQVEQG
jgi:hypothetical protein